MRRLIPVLPVPNFVFFPGCTVSLQFGFPALQEQLQLARRTGGKLVVAHSLKTSRGWAPSGVGCLAEIREIKTGPHGLQATLAGLRRVKLFSQANSQDGCLLWECELLPHQTWPRKKQPELSGLPDKVRACRGKLPPELWLDVAAFHIQDLPLEQKLDLLAEPDPARRYHRLLERTRRTKDPEPRIFLN